LQRRGNLLGTIDCEELQLKQTPEAVAVWYENAETQEEGSLGKERSDMVEVLKALEQGGADNVRGEDPMEELSEQSKEVVKITEHRDNYLVMDRCDTKKDQRENGAPFW
jgi:hypothetical protein